MEWVKVYDRAFNLHAVPRPKIVIIRQFESEVLIFETTKIGSWDFNFIGWIVPIINTPVGIYEGKYRRLYLGRQTHILQPTDLLGNIEVKPRLWIPDLTVRIWELQGYKTSPSELLTNLQQIELKVDGLNNFEIT